MIVQTKLLDLHLVKTQKMLPTQNMQPSETLANYRKLKKTMSNLTVTVTKLRCKKFMTFMNPCIVIQLCK
jgi:hypothetical protein